MTMSEAQAEPPSSRTPATTPSSHSAAIDVTALEHGKGQAVPRLHILFEPGDEPAPEALTEHFVETCCQQALRVQTLLDLVPVSDLEISVQLLDSESMRTLNLEYRQKDRPTNVLSFASDMPVMSADDEALGGTASGGLLMLGDVVLCPSVVYREAEEQSKSLLNHWAHMLIHGTLHLCGYDHENEQEAELMEAAEIQILSSLGIADPYSPTNAAIETGFNATNKQ